MSSVDQNSESAKLLEAQAHIWNRIFNFINSMSLKTAVELGIPDTIHRHGKPMTLSELINELPINRTKATCVSRLMRILIHSGFFILITPQEEEEEGYLLTPACKLLLKDEPMSVTPFLLSMLDPILTNPWNQLSQWFRNDDHQTPFAATHGETFWDLTAQNPNLNSSFNEAMASDARLVSRVIIQDFKHVFEGISSLVDVGGGTGTMAKAFTDAFPHLKCVVLDLPHVVDGLDSHKNLEFVAGDMFQFIPSADAVLLKWILHVFSDEECVEILKKCKEAIPSKEKGGKVMIMNMVLNAGQEKKRGNASMTSETQLFFDMLMMVAVQGKERSEDEWALLFSKAGFISYQINYISELTSLIEVFY